MGPAFAWAMAGAASAHQAATATREDTSQQRAGRTRRTSAEPRRAQQGASAATPAAPAALDSLSRLQRLADASPQVAQLRRLQALADAHNAPVSQLAGGPEEKELIQGKFESVQRLPLASVARDVSPVQRELKNTRINPETINPHKDAVEDYAMILSQAVENARDMIFTKYFVHVPPVDGYMQNLFDNFDSVSNEFIDGAAMPRQAGYWIESYATKIAAPVAGGGLNVILQAKRGNSRPDVILQFGNTDIAWLDITSSDSEGHIYDKDHDGWHGMPYVTEVTYLPLKLTELNTVSVPDKSTKDISGLMSAAKEAYKKQLDWEANVLEVYGKHFGSLMQGAFYYAKKAAVKYDEDGISSGSEWDSLFSPDEPGNKFEKLALAFVQEKADKQPDAHELTAVIMYWNGMISRYEKRFEKKLPEEFYVPSKMQLGLSWIKDISSADGEPIVREWFPV